MTSGNDGRVYASEGGMPIYSSVDALFNGYYDRMRKTAGSMGYGTRGAVNTIYGEFISAIVFACDNAFSSLGVKAWDKTGIRVEEKLAQKGGIGTNRGGILPTSVRPDLNYVQEPYKELPYTFNYDFGLEALESKDDTITWQNYIELQGRNYSDAIDFDLLAPTETATPYQNGEEIQIEKLSRIVAAFGEIGKTYNTKGEVAVAVTADKVSPYGGPSGSLYPYRSAGVSGYDAMVFNNNTAWDNDRMQWIYSLCANYWTGSANPQNKIWLMSMERQRQVSKQQEAAQRFLESVFITRDINGVSTTPGRETGFVAMATNNIPHIVDGNLVTSKSTQKLVGGGGDTFLLDLDHIWYKALRPVEFGTNNQYLVTRILSNVAGYFMQGEVVSNMWACHGKITQST